MAIGKWAEEWKATKKTFETTTSKKKPAPTFMGKFRKSTGIESALKKLDAAYATLAKQKDDKSALEFDKALKEYDKKMVEYVKMLDESLKKEKDADSAYSKGLVLLKKDLKSINAVALGQLTFQRNLMDKELSSQEKIRRSLIKLLIGSNKKAAKWIAEIKTAPTTENFNAGIQKAARDVTQNLKNITKAQSQGDARWQGDPSNLVKVLEAWGDKGRKVPGDADEKGVLRELGAFAQAVKGVQEFAKANDK